MRNGLVIFLLIATSALAAPEKTGAPAQKAAAPPVPTPAAELQQKCASRMYAERAGHPRGAVNWNVYDRCMRQAGAKP